MKQKFKIKTYLNKVLDDKKIYVIKILTVGRRTYRFKKEKY